MSGSPVTTSGTLNLQWLVPPSASVVPNSIVKRDADGSIALNNLVVDNFILASGSISSLSSSSATAIQGDNSNTGPGQANGIEGTSQSGSGSGVIGRNFLTGYGVRGIAEGSAGQGVFGESFGTQVSPNGFGPDGVDGISHSSAGSGVAGVNNSGGDGVFAQASSGGFAGFFLGNVQVNGNVSKAGGSFQIDHPLDPANKYLSHSFVESPDMMNVYNGNVTTDAQGKAMVQMPEWFEALNRDFRYQLTVIGQFAEAMVSSEIATQFHHPDEQTQRGSLVAGDRHSAGRVG